MLRDWFWIQRFDYRSGAGIGSTRGTFCSNSRAVPLLVFCATFLLASPITATEQVGEGSAGATIGSLHPDLVYPIPNNFGKVNGGGVNLLTGDANLRIPLATLSGLSTSFTLSAFYNSRSPGLDSHPSNSLGGYGWKLLDYPKIVQDGATAYFLDGQAQYELEGSNGVFSPGGVYYLWTVTSSGGATPASWTVKTETGLQYNLAFSSSLGTATAWHLSTILDPNWGDRLTFSYQQGALQSVTSLLGKKIALNYTSGLLTEVDFYEGVASGGGGQVVEKLALGYTASGPKMLQSLERSNLLQTGAFTNQSANIAFTYYSASDDYPDALSSVINTDGSVRSFIYYGGTRIPLRPVIRYSLDNGYVNFRSQFQPVSNMRYRCPTDDACSALWYNFSNWAYDSDSIYAQFNEVFDYPGGIPTSQDSTNSKPTNPFGFQAYYFFSGNPCSGLLNYPSDYSCTDSSAQSKAFRGLAYLEETLSEDPSLPPVSMDSSFWKLSFYLSGQLAPFAELALEAFSSDGVTQSQKSYTYDDTSQLPVEVSWKRRSPQLEGSAGGVEFVETVVESTTYAFEKYPALNAQGLHILTVPAQVSQCVIQPGQKACNVVEAQTVHWQQWNNASEGQWAPVKTYVLQQQIDGSDLGNGFNPSPPAQWLLTQQVLGRTSKGLVTRSATVDGVVSSMTFDQTYQVFPVSTSVNADLTSGQAGYYGVEDYEATAGWTLSNGSASSSDAHTGFRSYSGSGAVSIVPSAFSPRPGADAYVVSAWLKPASGTQCSLSFSTPAAVSTSNADGWQYVQAVTTSPSSSNRPTAACPQGGAIDDFRYGPADATFSAAVYDLVKDQVTATLDQNGATMQRAYTAFREPLGVIGPSGEARRIALSYNSRWGNRIFAGIDEFDADFPNLGLTALARTSGQWDGFRFAASTLFDNLNQVTIDEGGLAVSGTLSGQASATFDSAINDSDYLLSVDVSPANLAAGQQMGLVLGSGANQVTFALQPASLTLSGGGANLKASLDSAPDYMTLSLQVVDGKNAFAYANGRFLFDFSFAQPLSGTLKLVSTNPSSYFDNFFFLVDPSLTMTTYDAAQAPRQRLASLSADEIVITETIYTGDLNLPTVETKQTHVEVGDVQDLRAGLSYKNGFVTTFDADTLEVTGGFILQQWPAEFSSRPFQNSRTPEANPHARLDQQGSGGDYAAGAGNATDYAYGNDSQSSQDDFGFDSGSLSMDTTTGPDKLETRAFRNPQRLLFGQVNLSNSGQTLQQQMVYDPALNQTKTYQPNFFDSEANSNYFIARGFDFLGRQTSHRSPDTGTRQMAYDSSGRLRLMLDANGAAASSPYFLYWKYDGLGRVTEKGLYSDPGKPLQLTVNPNSSGVHLAASSITLQSGTVASDAPLTLEAGQSIFLEAGLLVPQGARLEAAIAPDVLEGIYRSDLVNPDWPTTNTSWQKKYRYDVASDGTAENSLGQLVSVQVSGGISEAFAYDRLGNVTAHTLTTTGAPSGYTFTYAYNLSGAATAISSPNYSVAYRYDALNRTTGIGTAQDEEAYASYSYANTSLTETLNGGSPHKIVRQYTTNAAGWIESITDPFFQETLFYKDRKGGEPGSGYFNGQIASADYQFSWSQAPDGYTYQYHYDPFGRLISAQSTDRAFDVGVATPLLYDSNSNLLAISRSGTTTQYSYLPGTNQVSQIGATGGSYSYDANGSVIAAQPLGLSSLAYSKFSGLATAITNSNATVVFEYGASDQRVSKSGGPSAIQYFHGLNSYPLVEKAAGTGSPSDLSYVYGPMGLVSIISGADQFFVLRDHLGSTRVVVDEGGNVQSHFNYLPFGDLISSNSDAGGSVPVRYLFTGQEFDSETGLYNYRARLYESGLTRFYSPDPEQQFVNPYIYAGGDPVLYGDPSGLWSWGGLIGAVAVGAVIAAAAIVAAPAAVALAAGASVATAISTGVAVVGVGAVTAAAAAGGAAAGGAYMALSPNDQPSEIQAPEDDQSAAPGADSQASGHPAQTAQDSESSWRPPEGTKTWCLNPYTRYWRDMGLSYDVGSSEGVQTLSKDTQLQDGAYIYSYSAESNSILIHYYGDIRYNNDVKHSQLAAGSCVYAAGRLEVKGGKVDWVDNASGHYLPDPCHYDHQQRKIINDAPSVQIAIKKMQKLGLDTSSTQVQGFYSDQCLRDRLNAPNQFNPGFRP